MHRQFRASRVSLKLSQDRAAEEIAISQAALSKFERGQMNLDREHLGAVQNVIRRAKAKTGDGPMLKGIRDLNEITIERFRQVYAGGSRSLERIREIEGALCLNTRVVKAYRFAVEVILTARRLEAAREAAIDFTIPNTAAGR
jgi:transcriptional regulator with XRE-family HTH domain